MWLLRIKELMCSFNVSINKEMDYFLNSENYFLCYNDHDKLCFLK